MHQRFLDSYLFEILLFERPSATRQVPYLDGMIVAAARQQFFVRRPRDTSDRLLVAAQCVESLARCRVPHLDRLVLTGRGQPLPVRAERHAPD